MGLRPTHPFAADGYRIDPPVSVPTDAKQRPAAVATPEPLDETPLHRVASHGFTGTCKPGKIRSERTLAQDELAEDDRTRSFQPRDDGRVEVRHEVGKDLRARHGANAARIAKVLHPDRHAVQRPAVPAGADFGVCAPGARDRLFGHDRDVALQPPVHRGDPVEHLLRQIRRQDFPRRDPPGDVRKARVVQRPGDSRGRSSCRAESLRRRGGRQCRNASQPCQEIAARQHRFTHVCLRSTTCIDSFSLRQFQGRSAFSASSDSVLAPSRMSWATRKRCGSLILRARSITLRPDPACR